MGEEQERWKRAALPRRRYDTRQPVWFAMRGLVGAGLGLATVLATVTLEGLTRVAVVLLALASVSAYMIYVWRWDRTHCTTHGPRRQP